MSERTGLTGEHDDTPAAGTEHEARPGSEDDDSFERVDVLAYRFPAHDDRDDRIRTVPAGMGEQVVLAHEVEARRRRRVRAALKWVLAAAAGAGGWLLVHPAAGVVLAVLVVAVFSYTATVSQVLLPEVVATDLSPGDARAMWDAPDEPEFEATTAEADLGSGTDESR